MTTPLESPNRADELAAEELRRTSVMSIEEARSVVKKIRARQNPRTWVRQPVEGTYRVVQETDECGRPTGRFKIKDTAR